MTAAALVQSLRDRGVTLRVEGDRLKFRPASAVTPDEVEALRQHKAEVLRLLTPAAPTLDPTTVAEVLGDRPTPHDLAIVRFEVVQAVHALEVGIRAGTLPVRRLIHGRPLADWLSLDDVAQLLREGGRR